MRIHLNGKPAETNARTISELFAELSVPAERKGTAAAVNGTVVPRANWLETPLREGDAVEIIRAVQGG